MNVLGVMERDRSVEAHRGEHIEMPEDAAAMLGEWQRLMKIDRYLDIEQPWLTSA